MIAAQISRAGVYAELLEDLLLHHELVAAFLRRVSVVVPAELPVLGTAVSGECGLLISVDRDLLDLQDIDDILIIRPGEYWRRTTGIEWPE